MKKFILFFALTLAGLVGYAVLISLYLPVQNPLQKADAIVTVSGGDTNGRTKHAVDLYKAGWAPKLVFSGAAKDPASASNAKVMLSIAVANGVPRDAISIDEAARDTKENAVQTKNLTQSYKTLILVTSDYHQRRVYQEFRLAYGPDVNLINSPAKDKYWGRKSWFLSPYGWWISAAEPFKLFYLKATQ